MNQPPRLQNLPRTSALLCLEVERFCLRQLALPRGSHLVLAVSGGADSTALALILSLLTPRLNLRLHALSINHGLRPEAGDDAAHAQAVCHALGISCTVRTADVTGFAASHHVGEEAAGRALRYALLEKERMACQANFIALGHHREDLSEDILLRLIRGAGWPSLGGMPARDDDRHLLRPLLTCCPNDLKQLLLQCGLSWREDASNLSTQYRRNRLRHQVLPLLRAENPALERSVGHVWQLAGIDRDYWEKTLDAALLAYPWREMPSKQNDCLTTGPSILLPRALLRALHPAARLRLYMRAVRHLSTGGMPASDAAFSAQLQTGATTADLSQPEAATSALSQPDVTTADLSPSDAAFSAQSQPDATTAALLPSDTAISALSQSTQCAQGRASTLLALDEALTQGRGNTRFQLPGGFEAYIKGGSITFSRPA